MACIVCHSRKTEVLYPSTLTRDEASTSSYRITESSVGKHAEIVRCKVCTLVFVSTPPFKDSHSYYEDQSLDEVYLEEKQNRRRVAKHVLKRIEKLRKRNKGKLMDLGCSTGTFLFEARKRGWEVFGIELATWAAEEAKKTYDIDVIQGSIFEKLSTFPDNHFDVIVAFDVIEHVERPDIFVKLVLQKLAKDGSVLLGTPNIDSLMAKITKNRWYAIVPSHLFYFSPKTLTRLLTDKGFADILVKTHTRFFSLWYIGHRLEGFSFILFELAGRIMKSGLLKNIVIPINLGQEMVVYARKR